jgi:hypothetical protein
VLEMLGPVVAKHPGYIDGKLLERICESERQIICGRGWHTRVPGDRVFGQLSTITTGSDSR